MQVQRDVPSLVFSAYVKGRWSDITIINGDKQYRLHKHILSYSIPYFEKMFSSGLEESKIEDIKLDHPSKVFDLIIDWAYGTKICITKENAADMFHLADYMNITELTDKSLDLLWDDLSDLPLIDIERWIKVANEEVRKIIDRYICLNFWDIVGTNAFLNYDADTVTYMIDRDKLYITNESQVFEAIMRWVEADEKIRSIHLPSLLAKARWRNISGYNLLTKMSQFPWLKKYEEFRPIVMASVEFILYGTVEEVEVTGLSLNSRQSLSLVTYEIMEGINPNSPVAFYTQPDSTLFMNFPFYMQVDANLFSKKFLDPDVTDHKIENSNKVIRIDWKNSTCRLFSKIGSHYDVMFGRLFQFDFVSGEVYLWKGERSIRLESIPDDLLISTMVNPYPTVTKYAGFFYATHIIYSGFFTKFRRNDVTVFINECKIAKFDPCANAWCNLNKCKIITDEAIKTQTSRLFVDSIEIYVDDRLTLTYDITSNTFNEKNCTEKVTFEKTIHHLKSE